MSVLIKGMEMPKKGVYDAIITFDGDSVSVRIPPSKEPVFSGRIVHIPTPHGRLIDADKLQTAIHGCLCENCQTFPCEKGIGCLIEDVFNLLDEAPTIIEAEGVNE